MIKKFFIFLILLSTAASAQLKVPVKWTFTVNTLQSAEYELIFTANIEKGWHLYSQDPTNDGPLPTEFSFSSSADYKRLGKTTEPKSIEKAEPVFNNAFIKYFEGGAVFHQKIKRLSPKAFQVKGTINGMTCNDSQCVPFSPPVDFVFDIPEGPLAKENTPDKKDAVKKEDPASAARKDVVEKVLPVAVDSPTSHPAEAKKDSVKRKEPAVESQKAMPVKAASRSWYVVFVLGFLGGFAALLTPCVFPMIPMTVSFFTKRSKTKAKGVTNALIYSGSIVFMYVLLGLGVTFFFGSDALNRLSTNVWFNIFFFVLLVVFAISFLGAFEIVLPSSFVNKVDSASDRGGIIGILFMALALSLVSFSCTGPIIGTLLVEAASIGGSGPFWGMLGFALALAFPFGFFAAFPGWMNTLPKSGGWLNTVKVFLGFLELALAFKFLSNADLVEQAGILTREVFLVIWIIIFGVLGVYLMGGFRLSHDAPVVHIPIPRLLMAMLVFSFTLYLIPGLWGAPLKLISGLAPPQFYSESPEGFGTAKISDGRKVPEHAHLLQPNNIIVFDDLKYATEYAKQVNKPIMIDFTGLACANCRKMEQYVWTDPEVKRRLNEDVVLVSLYVDDAKELPAEEQKEVEWNGKRTLKTIGNKWSYLQANTYGANSQPQHRIIAPDGQRLSDSTGYDPDVQKYIRWLDKGVEKYKSLQRK
ncbi:MAG TPA: cytochrome c biogenesis protein CcdA [Bacteroidia bacterium]|jgi:thiol:disulfide interchange protein DsbD|nr:cytochrome c biogenesis protein CcdA [Bacteroidia bacterium]